MRRAVLGCLISAAVSLMTVPVRAELVVTVSDATIAPGTTGTLDVYLTSTAASTSPDTINNYAFDLLITPTTAGELKFSDSQSFSYLNDSSYVFHGNSADAGNSPPSGGAPSTSSSGYANDSFVGFDNTSDFSTVSLSSSSKKVLLASLTLDATITSAGETFTVSLVPTSGDGSMNSGASSYFNVVDSGFNQISAVPFTSNSGTVTIGTASVPEPSTLVLGLTGLLLAAGDRARRRFRRGGSLGAL